MRIEAIAAGGAGVGRIEGLTCFVPRSAAGDLAQVAYVNHGRYARGRVLQLLESSPDRVTPPCVHYIKDNCGGCQVQHLSSDAQRAARQRIVRDALQRVGHREVPMPSLTTGLEWGYRERLTLTLKARGSGYIGGLIPLTQPAMVFALEECHIAHPRLVEVWHDVRGLLRGLPPVTANGDALRLSLRLSARAGDANQSADLRDVSLVVQGGTRWPDAAPWAMRAFDAVKGVAAVWWERDGGEPVCLAGNDDPDAISFAQVNPAMAEALRSAVMHTLETLRPTRVIDAYAGRGDLAVRLAGRGVQVTAIEADAAATARAAARLAPFTTARVITALVEHAIDDALNQETRADVVVLNPPRRGLDVRVTSALADAEDNGVRAIVYISCDPATLARDLSRLTRWRIEHVQCFDMFPQTAHVETVCVLVPEKS